MRCCLIFYLILLFSAASGQVKVNLSGVVQSGEGAHLTNSSILVFQDEKQAASTFTFTDENGFFNVSISMPVSQLRLVVSHLGYVEKEIKIEKQSLTDTGLYIKISLIPRSILLDSVIISGLKPITIKGDTTIFNARSFGSQTENKVEDLLKNLPGMQVDEDGNLRFKNKAISKVTIDGVDLFSEDYKKLTKNLSSGYLNSVEVIENYSENPVLKDFDFNKRSVINLTLNKSVVKVFGEVQAADDPFTKHGTLNGNIFSLLGKLKIAAIGNYNNMGNSLSVNNLQNKRSLEDILNPTSIEIPYNNSSLHISPAYAPGLNKNKYYLNNDKKYSINIATKLLKSIETKADINFTDLKSNQFSEQITNFLLSEPPLLIEENRMSQFNLRQMIANGRLTYNEGDKLKIDFKSKLFLSKNTSSSILNASPANNNLQRDSLHDNFFNSTLRITKKLGYKKAGELEAVYQTNYTPDNFLIDPVQFQSFIGLPLITNLNYIQSQRVDFFSLKPKYFLKKSSANFEKELQLFFLMELRKDQFNNKFSGSSASSAGYIADPPFYSDQAVFSQKEGPELAYQLSNNKFVFTINPTIHYVRYNFEKGFLNTGIQKYKGLIYSNSISYKRNIISSKSIELKIDNSSFLPEISELFTGYKIRDYRTFTKFDLDTTLVKGFTNRIQLLYSNTDVANGKMLIANITYNFGQNNSLTMYNYNNNYAVQNILLRRNKSNALNGFLIYEETLPSINSRITINSFFLYLRGNIESATGEVLLNSVSSDESATFQTAFKKPYNFKTEFVSSFSKQFSTLSDFSTFQYRMNFEASLNTFHKKFLNKFTYQYVHFNQGEKGLNFIDFVSQYKIKNKNITFSIAANNLLNNKLYSSTFLSQEIKTEKTIQLQPRQLLFGVSYKF